MALRYALMRDFNKHELFIYSFYSDEEPRFYNNHNVIGSCTVTQHTSENYLDILDLAYHTANQEGWTYNPIRNSIENRRKNL